MNSIAFKSNLIVTGLLMFFTALTFSVQAGAENSSLETELGFKTLSDKSAPTFLKDISNSVYEVRIPFEDLPKDIRILDLNGHEFKKLMNQMANLSESELNDHERVVINKQVERCRRDKIEKNCPVLLGFERATAFLAGGDGSYLITNAHVVNRFVKLKSALIGKPVLEFMKTPQWLPIFLFDQSGALILDPFLNPPALIKYGQPSALSLISGKGWYGDDSDYVVIKLSQPLGKPIPISKSKTIGEKVFRLGFSSCTGCSENSNKTDPELNVDRGFKGNSDGKQLYWTSGEIKDLNFVAEVLNTPPGYFDYTHKKNWIFFNADAQVGMSGGPIVNTLGEVIGVFAGSKPKINADGSMGVMSRGVRPPEFN